MRIKFQNIPPTDALPKGTHALIEELRTLHDRRRAAITATIELQPTSTTGGLDDQAQRADEAAVAEAIRKGTTPANPTGHRDALNARRTAAAAQVTALEAAITAADRDLDEWVNAHEADIIRHQDDALTNAADHLTDMLATIAPARAAYDRARAARRWTDSAKTNSIVNWTVTGSDGTPQREHTPTDQRRHSVSGF